jgi:hypothetical protein
MDSNLDLNERSQRQYRKKRSDIRGPERKEWEMMTVLVSFGLVPFRFDPHNFGGK